MAGRNDGQKEAAWIIPPAYAHGHSWAWPKDMDECVCCSAVLMAEIVGHYFPKLVELHNYRCIKNAYESHTVLACVFSFTDDCAFGRCAHRG